MYNNFDKILRTFQKTGEVKDYEGARIRNPDKTKKKYGLNKDGTPRTKKQYVLSGDREDKRSKHRAAIWGAAGAALVSTNFINKK